MWTPQYQMTDIMDTFSRLNRNHSYNQHFLLVPESSLQPSLTLFAEAVFLVTKYMDEL